MRKDATDRDAPEEGDVLSISPEKVCFIIIKAREFDAKDAVTDPDPGSNPTDDREAAVLEDHEDDPVVEELTGFIGALTEDEQIDLVALAWLGRDDFAASDWDPSATRPRARITTAPRAICSACRCLATFLKRGCRCSAIPARNSRSAGCKRRPLPAGVPEERASPLVAAKRERLRPVSRDDLSELLCFQRGRVGAGSHETVFDDLSRLAVSDTADEQSRRPSSCWSWRHALARRLRRARSLPSRRR